MWEINWLAVIVSALSTFLVGGLWYGPLFLKPWQEEAGVTDEDMQRRHPAKVYGGAFLLNVFAAYILGHVLATYGNPPFNVDIMIAFGVALGFIVTAFGVNYLFAGKSIKLFAIDAGYWIVTYTLMGVIFGYLG
jgi:Protein of unknown function (DUF1761)